LVKNKKQNMAEMIIEPIEKYGLKKKHNSKTLFSHIGVIGCGWEGSYIATVAAICGMEVVFLEPDAENIEDAFSRIEKKLDRRISTWGLTESEKRAILSRVKGTNNFNDLSDCDFVIESIRYDDYGVKSTEARKAIFQVLEDVLHKDAIIASNVSMTFVTELAVDLKHKERTIGLHFLSVFPDSDIIEIVPSIYTSDDTYMKVCQFAKLIKHTSIKLEESSGLVSLRLFFVQLNEACSILMEGIATVEAIDKVLTVGFGHKEGVFRTADKMGVEKIVHLMELMFQEYGNVKYKPSPLLNRLYRSKHYGIRTGKGFYTYDKSGNIII
jgi:3-hydroxybutyryl-CoA dehydrogenase